MQSQVLLQAGLAVLPQLWEQGLQQVWPATYSCIVEVLVLIVQVLLVYVLLHTCFPACLIG